MMVALRLKFKIDENLPGEVASLLREAGHDAMSVLDQQMSGATDEVVADVCRQKRRAVVTLDTDFADIRTYPPNEHAGIVVLRLARQDVKSVLGVMAGILPLLQVEPVAGRLWIVDESRVRIRGDIEN